MQHPSLGWVLYNVRELSDDPDTQVAQTIDLMRQYATEDSQNPILTIDVYQAWQSGDPIADTWAYLARYGGQRGMQFVRDEQTGIPFEDAPSRPGGWRPLVEALIRPVDQCSLAQTQGDCDDFAMYAAAHLMARGVPCSFATLAAEDPYLYSHVYLVAYPTSGPWAGQRVAMDLSHGQYPGWEAPNRFGKFREWPLRSGIGLLGWAAIAAGGYLLYRVCGGVN